MTFVIEMNMGVRKRMKRRQRYMFGMILANVLIITGCSSIQVEEALNPVIEVQKEKEPIAYTMDVVRRGDVTNSVTINCSYKQIEDEDLSFGVDNELVEWVYVEKGDSVKKGDLLAELKTDQIETKRNDLKDDLTYQKLLLKQLQEQMDFDLNARKERYEVSVKQLEEPKAKKQEQKLLFDDMDQIKKSYRTSIEDYEDAISINEYKIKAYEKKISDSKLYAGMDGIVSYIKDDLIHCLTTADETVIKIIDSSVCSFTSEDIDYKDYFKEGQTVMITIGYGVKAIQKEAYPMNFKQWDENMYFELAETEYELALGTRGKIDLVLETAKDVLYLKKSAIHTVGEESYVYVVDQEGMRSIQYVNTGLIGTDTVEIVSGLKEGDYVVLK